MLSVIGSFFFLMALYETFEYIFCYNEEKEEQSKTLKLLKRAHRLAARHLYRGHSSSNNSQETVGLLSEESIPLDTFQSINSNDVSAINSNSAIEPQSGLINNVSEH